MRKSSPKTTRNRPKKAEFNFPNALMMGLGALSVFAMVLGFFSLILNDITPETALAASEPNCQDVSANPVWNPYPIQNNLFPNPDINSPGACQGMPMLSFFPVDTDAGNPRTKTILQDETVTIHIYYNNGANVGAAPIQNPRLATEVIQESDTRYRIRATLSGNNVAAVTSAQKGGDLIVNVPSGTNFDIVARGTNHFPDAIERREEADTTGRRPNDLIPDNTVGSNVSNPIYTRFDGANLQSTDGFQLKPNLESRFLGYGYVLAQMRADVDAVSQNTPPQIPGEEITIIRGESGSFQPLAPTDPENDHPISLDTSQIPNGCTLTGTPNSVGGGQIITCDTDENTPVRQEFVITPTDSRGLVGTPGTFIVNVIDPQLSVDKTCYVRGTTTECENGVLQAGDEITYEISATNDDDTVPVRNLRIVDDYDEQRITNITNISDNGVDDSAAGLVRWNGLGDLAPRQTRTVTFDAVVADSVQNGDVVENIATVSSDNFPDETAEAEFTIGGSLNISKECFVRGTTTPCNQAPLNPGDEITYEIEVINATTSVATNVVVTDTYEADKITDITNIQPSGTHDTDNATITWNFGDMQIDEIRRGTFDATVADGLAPNTNILNIAVVTSDNNPEKRAEVEFRTAGPNLDPIKLCYQIGTTTPCSLAQLRPGDSVTYVIRTTNTGSTTATNVTISDTYPTTQLTNITGINPAGNHNPAAGTIVWNLGNLEPQASTEVTFNAQIVASLAPSTIIRNTAVVGADNIPPQTVFVEFPISVPVATVTPRSGGGLALAMIVLIAALGTGGYYYYRKTSKKYADGFVPARNAEEGSDDKVKKSSTRKKIKR
jgi:uncharacterized repeat protein (TIGR01451 family)